MKKISANRFISVMLLVMVLAVTHAGRVGADSVPSASVIQFSMLNQQPDPVEPGNFVELRWLVTNEGYIDARDVTFEIVYDYPFQLPEGDNGQRKYAMVAANPDDDESIVLYYKLLVDPDAVEGTEKLKLRYKIGDGEWRYSSDEFEVRIKTYDSYLSISHIQLEPSTLEPGQTAKLTLTLKNSADTVLNDIKVALAISSDSTPFSPVRSSNEKLITTLGKGESKDISFSIVADPDATLGLYKVPVELAYRDTNGDNFTDEVTIGLVVDSPPDVYASIDDTEILTAGDSGKVTLKFVNKGISDIKFLNVKLEPSKDYDILSSPEVYIGNIDSDDYETVDFKLYVKATASNIVELPVKYSYRNTNNELYEERQNLKLRLYTEEELKKYGFVKESNFSAFAAVAIVLVASYILWRRFKKRK